MAHVRCESVVWQKVVIAIGFVMLCTGFAFAESSKIAKDLRGKSAF